MKFVAFRIDEGVLDGMKIIHAKYSVKGQRETDLNWSDLATANSEAEAKKIAFALRYMQMQILSEDALTLVPVFDCGGYEIV